MTVPFAPVPGVEHVAVGPLFCTSDTNVVPLGSGSFIITFIAISGPPFERVIVYVTGFPAVTVAGPVFVTETSTEETVTASVPLLFSAFGSFVEEIVAVFENTVPDGVPGGI